MPIRPARPDDAEALYDICLRTGAAGADASGHYDDARLLGEVYVGPYLRFEPRFAFVATLAEDPAETPHGYVLGAVDTHAFQEQCARHWWPELRNRYPLDEPRRDEDQALVRLIHHPPDVPAQIADRYPSHLHVDLLPTLQGRGLGRELVERLLAALASAGSTGVHLGVSVANTHAIGFYRRLGFTDLAADDDGLVLARSLLTRPGRRPRPPAPPGPPPITVRADTDPEETLR